MKYVLLILLFITTAVSAQVIQERNSNGADRRIITKLGFRVPLVCGFPSLPDLLNYTGDSARGAMVFDTCSLNLLVWTDTSWSILGNAGTDTTIFDFVIDSTGQSANRVLFAGGNKIRSDNFFLYDSVNNKLVVNHQNISVGGPSTKLWIQGNAKVTALTTTTDLTVEGLTDVYDTTTYKPAVANSSGVIERLAYWPVGSGSGGDYVDTIYRKPGQDSIFFTINGGVERAIKDSTGTGGGGVTAVGAFQSGGTANGASIGGSDIYMHKVTATTPGMLSTGADSIAGAKSFFGNVGIGNVAGASNNRLRIMTPSSSPTNDTVFSIFGDNGNKILTNFTSLGLQTWHLRSSAAGGAFLGRIDYSIPNNLPGLVFFNSTTSARTDLRYANNGLYFTSHSSATSPEASNSLGVLIRGNSAATTTLSIGSTSPNAAAALNLTNTTRGALLAPMSNTNMNAISSPPIGLIATNSSTGQMRFKQTVQWADMGQFHASDATIEADASLTMTSNWLQFIDATSGNITVTLPEITSESQRGIEFIIIRIDASANTVTIQRGTGDTINNGATSFTMAANERANMMVFTSNRWSATKGTPF